MSATTFDFIVVGGGTAGIALAARLSEIADQSVLVLEAGVDQSDNFQGKVPAFYAALLGTDVDWGFQTVPQEKLGGRPISLNQGKALGGSSIINAHVFAPPTRAILDDWHNLGNAGWNSAAMAPYYTKAFTAPPTPAEHRQLLGVDGDESESLSTTNGPLQLSYPGDPQHPIRKIWAETFEKKGRRMRGNWVDASVGGFSNLSTIDPVRRERCHAAKAYYDPVRERKNLHVVLAAHVSKIIFSDSEGQQPKAIGVQYTHEGQTRVANAGKEIILSAGALQSPKLLELSGVGNASILKQHEIDVVKDLPGVGENLQDHIVCDISFAVAAEMDTLDALARQEPQALQDAMINYTQKHEGVLTSGGIFTYAYLPTVDFFSDADRSALASNIAENRRQLSSRDSSSRTWEDSRAEAYLNVAAKTLLDADRPSAVYLSALGQNPAST
ncbi:hypothetical protein NPX13_g10997 [Xylaria arbuscula]|uniref:Glucose-methanol-choline oxidoreductase N-terminal domain-containing protein n=1 Tax=Xylaria arbuscula TaxID=114810 RepID=A0A9W8N3R5_9PEZI|nr:hypothetical protein NPX13_g10997 [Xylaria arbuscula]